MTDPRTILIHYLGIYKRKKNLRMKPVVLTMKKRLEEKCSITERQFLSVIKFIERERPFRHWTKEEIFWFFTPIIEEHMDWHFDYEDSDIPTLEPYFTENA